jgi:hypothetical protein
MKEQLLWLHRFQTIKELNQALRDFARRFKQLLDHRADRLPNARSAPTHPPRGGRVNTEFNLS